MRLVKQKNNKSCGQSCVAMIAGLTWEQSCKILGHNKPTTTKMLIRALHKLGFNTARKLKVGVPTDLAIVKEKIYYSSNWHWVVFYNGTIYDPSKGIDPKLPAGHRYTSYLEVY